MNSNIIEPILQRFIIHLTSQQLQYQMMNNWINLISQKLNTLHLVKKLTINLRLQQIRRGNLKLSISK